MHFFKIIPTKILVELFVTFFIMQIGFTILFVVVGIFMQDIANKIPLSQIPRLIPYVFPFSQTFCAQFVMLFTSMMIYSRITSSREILALQTSGISSWRIMFPSFLLAFGMSIFSFWMTDVNMSWGGQGIQKILISSAESIVYKTLKNEKCLAIGENYVLTVTDVDGKKLIEPFATSKKTDETCLFSAKSAQIEIGAAAKLIREDEICYTKTLDVYHVTNPNEIIIKLTMESPDFQYAQHQMSSAMARSLVLSLKDLQMQDSISSRPATMSLAQLDAFVERNQARIQELNQEIAFQTACTFFSRKSVDLANESWNQYYNEIEYCNNQIRRAKLEPTRRLAFAFDSFFLTWVFAPFSLKKGNLGALMLCCIVLLPLVLIYFPVTMLLINVVKDHGLSPLVMWVPNLCMFIIGIFFVRQAL